MSDDPDTSDDAEWPLGRRLHEARVERGLNIKQVARLAGMSDTMWRNLERGWETRKSIRFPISPRPETVAAAARTVGLNVKEALSLIGAEPDNVEELEQQPVDLTQVPSEALLGEIHRRLRTAVPAGRAPSPSEIAQYTQRYASLNPVDGPPTAEEIAANPERYTVLGQRSEDVKRQSGP